MVEEEKYLALQVSKLNDAHLKMSLLVARHANCQEMPCVFVSPLRPPFGTRPTKMESACRARRRGRVSCRLLP